MSLLLCYHVCSFDQAVEKDDTVMALLKEHDAPEAGFFSSSITKSRYLQDPIRKSYVEPIATVGHKLDASCTQLQGPNNQEPNFLVAIVGYWRMPAEGGR